MAKNWSAAHNFEIITMLVSDWRNKTMFNDWTSSDTNKLSLLLVWLPNTLLVINTHCWLGMNSGVSWVHHVAATS